MDLVNAMTSPFFVSYFMYENRYQLVGFLLNYRHVNGLLEGVFDPDEIKRSYTFMESRVYQNNGCTIDDNGAV